MRRVLNNFLVHLFFIYSFVKCQKYIGCFKDEGINQVYGHLIVYTKKLTPDVCINYCKEYGYSYIGLQYGNECFCGDGVPDESLKVNETECNFRCSGNRTQNCGGDFRNSVYKIINPKEGYENLGCYVPEHSPLGSFFKNYEKNLIPYLCVEFCKGNHYAFAQLQFGSLCSCENQTLPENTKTVDKNCNLKCTGDQTKICGGFFKNTVYYTGLTPAKPEEYVGCYKESRRIGIFGHRKEFPETLTYRTCLNYCKNLGYSYCGLQYGLQCLCGDETPDIQLKLDDDNCNFNCSGDDKQNCGGIWKNSVYKVKNPKEGFEYEGCFLDQLNSRELPDLYEDYRDELIPFVCINMCKEKGYKYAGLQYSSQCFCGKELPSYTKKVADTQCNSRCSGDQKKFCGAVWKNSVYNTGLYL